MILERIHSREDLLALTREEDEQLCREIRQLILVPQERTARTASRTSTVRSLKFTCPAASQPPSSMVVEVSW